MPRLLRWHATHKRSFIWRGLRRSPYVVLVSEYMLQQTGTKHIERRLPLFLKQFPNVKALAAAPQSEVLRAWQGLGYNRRAIYLHKAAKALAMMRSFPKTLEELQALPGVGRYTASAVLCFAMRQDVPVVDVNIERVISRLAKPMKRTDDVLPMQTVFELDALVLPHGRSSEWHEALMDLGATICTKRNPKCTECPLRLPCPSSKTLSTSILAPKRAEPKMFGQPRRIWRGRVLKVIAAKPASTKSVTTLLQKECGVTDSSFTMFITSITDKLLAEGFIKRSRHGTLSLAD